MANYHSPTVVQQTIPLADMTELEQLILSKIFESEMIDEGLYFTADEGPSSLIWIDRAALDAATNSPRAKDSAAIPQRVMVMTKSRSTHQAVGGTLCFKTSSGALKRSTISR